MPFQWEAPPPACSTSPSVCGSAVRERHYHRSPLCPSGLGSIRSQTLSHLHSDASVSLLFPSPPQGAFDCTFPARCSVSLTLSHSHRKDLFQTAPSPRIQVRPFFPLIYFNYSWTPECRKAHCWIVLKVDGWFNLLKDGFRSDASAKKM